MNRPLLYLHVMSVLAVCCLLGLSSFLPRATGQMSIASIVVVRSLTVAAAAGSITGLWLLAVTRETPGNIKSVTLVGVSTIALVLLVVLSL
jgi:hypothetical protein